MIQISGQFEWCNCIIPLHLEIQFIFKLDLLLNVYSCYFKNMSENQSRNLLDKYLDMSWWRHEVSGWTRSSPYHTLDRGLWRSPLHSVEFYTNSLYKAFVNIYIDTIAQAFLYKWQLLQKVKLAYKEHSIRFIFYLFFLNYGMLC